MDQMIFHALFEHSSLGIIISNDSGTIEKSNPYASKIFGYNPDELIGQKVEVLIPRHLREKHVGYREQYIKHPQPRAMGSSLNLLAEKKDGTQFPVEVSLSFFKAGNNLKIVSFINDVTERKRAEDNLKKLTEALEQKISERTKELSDALLELSHTNEGLNQEMEQRKLVETKILSMLENEKELNVLKSRFVSMASHEFRTPLSGILTSVSLIDRYKHEGDIAKRDKHILTIKKSVRNLTSILNDFLSLDKLEQGKVVSNSTQFDLSLLINELVEELKESNESKHQIEVQHIKSNLSVYQDKEMLRNVLINLLSNAIKYTPEQGLILIRTSLQANSVEIEIQDNGIGIPEEDQKHLFDRFFRAHNATTIKGTGLGLNIVKRYLDLMGGNISFSSVEAKGTTFKITLPKEKINEKDSDH